MKVTTELKKLIKRSFDEKRIEIRKEAQEKAEKTYQGIIEEITSSAEFEALYTASQNFYNKFKYLKDEVFSSGGSYSMNCKTYYTASTFDDLENINPRKLIVDNTFSYLRNNHMQNKETNKLITELDRQQESLMIKLTYERNLDVIKELLAEYDIEI